MFLSLLNETFFQLEMKTYWKGYNTLFEKECKVIHPKYYKHLKRCSKAIWTNKNGLVSGILACSSSKTEISDKIGIYTLILNFQVDFECFFTQKSENNNSLFKP